MSIKDKLIKKQTELIKKWEECFDFILKYVDYEKMSKEDLLKVWHLEYLQKITDIMTEISALKKKSRK